MFGLHAAFTVSDRTLEHCVGEAQMLGVGFHTHLAEDAADEDDSLRKYEDADRTTISPARRAGTKDCLRAWRSPGRNELQTLAETRTKLTHQPRSNMNNAVGVATRPARARPGRVRGA